MRILFLTLSSFSHFPCYKRAVGMGESLARLGHQVAIAVLDCTENRARMAKEAPNCQALWFRSGLGDEIADKIKMIWRWRPDVVYSASYSLHDLAGLRLFFPRGVRYVVEFCELYSRYPTRRLNWALWETLALVESSHVLCASQFLLDHFQRASARLHITRSFVYAPYAYPSYLRPLDADRTGKRRIVFMACMSRGYGAFEVLEAFQQLLKLRPNTELEMIGGGPDKAEVIDWVAKNELNQSVRVSGFVPEEELNAHFSHASVFVSPIHDTLQDRARCPSKLFYYLPYNKPIVTCRFGNPYDVLGKHGFYYCPSDVDDMAKALQLALDAEPSFSYPVGFIEAHSWDARAKQFNDWMIGGNV